MTNLNVDVPQSQPLPETVNPLAYGDTLMVVTIDSYSESMVRRVFANSYVNSHLVDSKEPIRKVIQAMSIPGTLGIREGAHLDENIFQLLCGYKGSDFLTSYIESNLKDTIDIITIPKRPFNIIMVDANLVPASMIRRFKTHKIALIPEETVLVDSFPKMDMLLRHSASTANIQRSAKAYMSSIGFDV